MFSDKELADLEKQDVRGMEETNGPPPTLRYKPFPVGALPEPVRSFVSAAAAIGCDVSFVVLPLLASLASAIGNTWRILLKRGWSEPSVIWAAIIGESGTVKSPAVDLATKAIRDRQAEAMKQFETEKKEFLTKQLRYRVELAEWKRTRKERTTDPPVAPEAPVCERVWCEDFTVEALADRLSSAPRGLQVIRDELSGWLGSFGQYKGGRGGDVGHYLSMHGARNLLVDRKTGDRTTIYIPRAAVSICGGIQPRTLRRCLGAEHEENGLLARLLVAMPPRRRKRWTEAEVSEQLHENMAEVFAKLFELAPNFDDAGQPYPKVIRLGEKAKKAFVAFANEHGAEQYELTGSLASAWSKLEGYAARFALVIHFVRCVAGDSTLKAHGLIDEQSVASGVVLSRWFGHEARRVYEVLHESEGDTRERELYEWIAARGGSVTPGEVQAGIRRLRKPGAAKDALEALVGCGLGRWSAAPTGRAGGRPSTRFELVSGVSVNETPTDGTENGGIADADTTDGGDGSFDFGANVA